MLYPKTIPSLGLVLCTVKLKEEKAFSEAFPTFEAHLSKILL